MIKRPHEIVSASPDGAEAAASGLLAQLGMMLRALLTSTVRRVLMLLAAALVGVIVVTAYGQIRLNSWNKPFYDALSRRDFRDFLLQLGVFALIAGSLLVLNVTQRWLVETLKLKLRDGLVRDLIGHWLTPGHAFRLASAGAIGVNPDQRMHEDARHLCELSADLGVGLLQASILLIAFIDVLWALSSGFSFHLGARSLVIPGYMVWAAVVYAGSASLVSYWVGGSLIDRNARRYAREAELRFSLVRVNEHIDAIALAGGEADEARRIDLDFAAVLVAMRRLVTGLTNLTWVTAGYGWFTLVAPIIAAAPLYFGGDLSFGGLMMAAGAFNQVQSSLRWFVDNFSTIADWRATLLRVASFRRAILTTAEPHPAASHIAFARTGSDRILIDQLRIDSPDGGALLREPQVQVGAGEHVLVVGEPGAGKTLLFRALVGLWPWGSGHISLPDSGFMAMPRTPYLPPGTLREVLVYPHATRDFEPAAFAGALQRLRLERLLPLLDESRRWDRELSVDEQQQLAFARVLLHAPSWLLIDAVFESLDADTLARVLEIFGTQLQHTAVIHIGRAAAYGPFFGRTLHLVGDPVTRRPAPQHRPGAADTIVAAT